MARTPPLGSSSSSSAVAGVWTQDGTTVDISYGEGNVFIGEGLDVSGYLKVPFGSSDVSSATYEGYIRYNDVSYEFQGYDVCNNVWSSLGSGSSGSGLAGVWTQDASGDISYGDGNVFIGAGLDVSGKLTVGGDVSANVFYGDGSNLTGISSSWVGTAESALNMGSNNINLLMPKGQFGTRHSNGKDAAAPRYIFTQCITCPILSKPLLPARPAICVYSCGNRLRIPLPEYLFNAVNITVFVGILIPTANVSVANNSLI